MSFLMQLTVLSLTLLFNPVASYALDDADIAKYSEESSQMRRDHILKMKEVHLKHVTDLYDIKLKHLD
jgi:hypothetical protein